MASYPGYVQTEPAKMEQIITEFFAKSLHIILESRCPYVSSRNYSGEQMMVSPSSSSSSSSSLKLRDKWFNLALRECPAALENIDFWRQSNLDPMVVDVILVQRPSGWDPLSCSPPRRGLVRNLSSKERFPNIWNSENDEFGCQAKTEKVIERWILQYESWKGGRDCTSGTKRSSSTSCHSLYRKSVLLLRSLYATVRLLPAYKLFRDLNSSGQILTYNLAHRVSSFVEPFTRHEESEMQQFVFTPVDTFCGRLCLSTLYRSALSDVSSQPSTPITPKFIPDYVGSPMADRLKRFPSIPVHEGSPSSSPFGRRHSWSYDLYRASPPSELPSPSPTYSDSHSSISKPSSHRLPPTSLPRHLPETPQFHRKNTNFDEYWPSPIFSPSPSPSPPTYSPGGHMSKALLRSESAPVGIPASKLANAPSSNNKQILPPASPLKGTRPVSAKTERNSGLLQSRSTVEKLFSSGKSETARRSGVKISSNSSPQKSFSGSPSRLSFQDDFDEFSGPFVVDDDDMIDGSSRPGSFDAAVGATVHLLRKAPPLRQDISKTINLAEASTQANSSNCTQEQNVMSEESGVERSASLSMTSSGHVLRRTTADALEELRGYRDLKDLLLRKTHK